MRMRFAAILLGFIFLSPWVFCTDNPSDDLVPPSDFQAINLKYDKPSEQILRNFLKQIGMNALGNFEDNITTSKKAFEVFLRNYFYNPERLIDEIPLKRVPEIDKLLKSILTMLSPKYNASVLTQDGDFFLYCETVTTPVVLAITFEEPEKKTYSERFKNHSLSIISPEDFSNLLLTNQKYQQEMASKTEFLNLLCEGEKLRPAYYNGFEGFGRLFFEVKPRIGYDLASITHEAEYFTFQKSLRQFNFLGIPILQYSVEKGEPFDFYFKTEDPALLKRVKALLDEDTGHCELKNSISKKIGDFLEDIWKNRLNPEGFEKEIEKMFDELNYSINYDAIVSDKKEDVFKALRIFLLSNDITSVSQFKENRKFVEEVIEKFFVLGTTYFYRCWNSIGMFGNYLGDIREKAKKEMRPLKVNVFACSTGEEVLTFAFALVDIGITDFRILGSDINNKFIETAKKMSYSRESFERLPQELRKHLLQKYFTWTPSGYEIKDKEFFSKRIEYRVLDITKPLPSDLPLELAPPYDIVSCQNIFMYLNSQILKDLYDSILNMVSDYGLFIVSDKYYDHYLLSVGRPHLRKLLQVNKYIAKIYPESLSKEKVLSELEIMQKNGFSTESVRQFDALSEKSLEEKKDWYRKVLKQPGNHEITVYNAGKNLIALKQYAEAAEILTKGIYEYPYLLDNYKLLSEAEKNAGNGDKASYVGLIIKGIDALYRVSNSDPEVMQRALTIYQRALKYDRQELLGYYVLGAQLLHHANVMKRENAFPVDYELYYNQAFKNFNYVLKKDKNNVYAARGIAEIALNLYEEYLKIQNMEIAERLIYNALLKLEPYVKDCKHFNIYYYLSLVQMKMGEMYLMGNMVSKGDEYLNKSLESFRTTIDYSMNYNYVSMYYVYVSYAELYLNLYKLNRKKNIMDRVLSDNYLKTAMDYIDTALTYNSVYGIEAVEMRRQICQESQEINKEFERSFGQS